MKKILLYLPIVVFGTLFCSCEDYLDVNESPNNVSESQLDASLLMPAAEMNLATSYGNGLRIIGGYLSQHFSQSFGTSNYMEYSKFQVSAVRCSDLYSDMYQHVLNNLKTIQEKSVASEDWGTNLAAVTLRAFTLQTLVDCFGEVPYTEMLDVSNTAPKYDEGKFIYESVIAEIDEALEKASAADLVCTNFLFPSEKADAWIKFANALKLKMYMRMSSVMDVKDKVSALVEEGNFPESDVAFVGCWADKSGEMSPYYAEEFSTSWGSTQVNVIANLAIIGTMQTDSYTDPRLAAFFEKNASGNYVGGLSGTNFKTQVKSSRENVMDAVERASLMAREGKNNLVKFSIRDDVLKIYSNAEMGNVEEELEISLAGDPVDIAFNSKYIADIIRNVPDEELCMKFNSSVSPCVVVPQNGDDYLYLILPVRVFQ